MKKSGTISAALTAVFCVPMLICICALTLRASASEITVSGTIDLGSYPQSRVTDGVLISALNSCAPDDNGDVVHDGAKYRRVYFSSSASLAVNNGYSPNRAYWFKYEPIVWRILASTGSGTLVVSEKLLDCAPYHSAGNGAVWEKSEIRQWLNGAFFDAAFTNAEKAQINISPVTNSDYEGTPAGDNTDDRVFLLSLTEATSPSLGFSVPSDEDASRRAGGTDYSAARGIFVNGESSEGLEGLCYWWLRSPGNESPQSSYVTYRGAIEDSCLQSESYLGVRPAMRLSGSNGAKATAVVLDAQTLELFFKDGATLSAEVYPQQKPVIWHSSDESVVTVDENGNVTATGKGVATLIARPADSSEVQATCTVIVGYKWWQWVIVIILFGWIWYD